jgi:hypothetical protein
MLKYGAGMPFHLIEKLRGEWANRCQGQSGGNWGLHCTLRLRVPMGTKPEERWVFLRPDTNHVPEVRQPARERDFACTFSPGSVPSRPS